MTEVKQDYIVKRGQAQEKWDQFKQTKYSDADIRICINDSKLFAELGESDFAVAKADCAQAMIAYNNMIDARIDRAQKSWGLR